METFLGTGMEIEQQGKVLEKITSILESVVKRVATVEAQPAAPKTVTTYAVEKELVNKETTTADTRVAEVRKRLAELTGIRETNLEKYQADHQDEAFKLMDELSALLK